MLAALVLGIGSPTAAAHDVQTARGHEREDAVTLTPAQQSRLGQHTRTATAGDARAAARAVDSDPGVSGRWGPVVDWPVVAIGAALLRNGKVLAFDTMSDEFGAAIAADPQFTRATVWDPVTGDQTPAMLTTGFNIFCSGLAHLVDGSLFVAGGNKNPALDGIAQTHIFDSDTNTWMRGPDMSEERWYPTVTPLRDGEMLITSGGGDVPEVRATDGSLRRLDSASLPLPLYPWMDVAPDGRAFFSGPDRTMRSLDPTGAGSWETFGDRDQVDRDYGSHVLFDIGRVLVAGGGFSKDSAVVVDLNGQTPAVSDTDPMATGRRQFNLTALADGTVLATGGNSSGAPTVDLDHGVYDSELWDPSTGHWRTLAAERVTRQYHSTALLLPDGRVLSAGGGICSDCDKVGYLAKNAQVFSPPYLFKDDGSGERAPRPTIVSAPSSVDYGSALPIATSSSKSIDRVALVRLGAVTHSVNMDQRYVPLQFDHGPGGGLAATAPSGANVAPPGFYMLFVIDSAGVPSVAKMVRVGGPDPQEPPVGPPTGPAPPVEPAPPANNFSLEARRINRRKGTAEIEVAVPGAGELAMKGRSLRHRSVSVKRVTGAGSVWLRVAPNRSAARRLRREGRLRVRPTITYTPLGGVPNSRRVEIELRRRHTRR